MIARPIVLIDDDRSWTESTAELLSDVGYPVETAEDGLRGLELLEQTTPVLVIIDMQLPRLSGLELLHELRRRHHDVPVLVVTDEDHTATLAEALGEGASSFMRKPVQPDLLISAVHRLLPEVEDSIA